MPPLAAVYFRYDKALPPAEKAVAVELTEPVPSLSAKPVTASERGA